jgi:hypothetical protein
MLQMRASRKADTHATTLTTDKRIALTFPRGYQARISEQAVTDGRNCERM